MYVTESAVELYFTPFGRGASSLASPRLMHDGNLQHAHPCLPPLSFRTKGPEFGARWAKQEVVGTEVPIPLLGYTYSIAAPLRADAGAFHSALVQSRFSNLDSTTISGFLTQADLPPPLHKLQASTRQPGPQASPRFHP